MSLSSIGSIIYGSDYNTVQLKVRGVLGDGQPYSYGTYGYGHSLASSLVNATDIITQLQWNNLIADVNTAYVHITGGNYTGYTASVGAGNILVSNLNNADDAMNYALTNRLTVDSTQQTTTAGIYSRSYGSTWGGGASGISSDASFTFASANAARYFFNAGGKLTFHGTYAYGSATPQNNAWNDLMTRFTYVVDYAEWTYIQTHNAPSFATLTGGTPYAANYVSVTTPSVTSNAVQFHVLYEDDHTSSWADAVDGTIGFSLTRNAPNFTSYQPTLSYVSGY